MNVCEHLNNTVPRTFQMFCSKMLSHYNIRVLYFPDSLCLCLSVYLVFSVCLCVCDSVSVSLSLSFNVFAVLYACSYVTKVPYALTKNIKANVQLRTRRSGSAKQ